MKSFLSEYRKCISCLVFAAILYAFQVYSGIDLSGTLLKLIDAIMLSLLGGAVKFSVLTRSEKETIAGLDSASIQADVKHDDYNDAIKPSDFN